MDNDLKEFARIALGETDSKLQLHLKNIRDYSNKAYESGSPKECLKNLKELQSHLSAAILFLRK